MLVSPPKQSGKKVPLIASSPQIHYNIDEDVREYFELLTESKLKNGLRISSYKSLLFSFPLRKERY